MFKNNVTLSQIARSATDLHPAIPAIATLRLRSENGASDRGDSHYGSVTIKHSPTKELSGGFRHVVRVDLREQGDIKPAFAYLVIGNHDSVAGEGRAVEALQALFYALLSFNDGVDITGVNGDGLVTSFSSGATTDLSVDDLLADAATGVTAFAQRLLARES